jgi:hypothetical protein
MGVMKGSALAEDNGPGLGRGMGMTTREKSVSTLVNQPPPVDGEIVYTCSMHPEVRSDKPGTCPKCGMTLVVAKQDKSRVPGYPQDDMLMIMDDAVAKPETYGLAPGWTASMMGMMTLVRVLPPDKYDEVMKRVREGRTEAPKNMPEHKHNQD